MASSIETGLNENFKKNLEHIQAEVDPETSNLDWPIVLEGEEGSGKSGLAQAIALEIEGEDFDPEKQIAFNGEDFKQKARELDPGKVLIYDEGVDDLMATDTMTSEGRSIVKFLRKCRELNLIIIICFPVFVEMNKKIRKNRVKTLGSARIKRSNGKKFRYCLFYNKTQIRKSSLSNDNPDPNNLKYPEAVLSVNWKDPRKGWPEVWNKYKEMKEGDIRDPEEEEDDIDLGQIIRIVKNRKEDYIDTYGDRKYIKKELIEYDFDIGGRKSGKVKAVVERDLGLNQSGQ